MKGKLLFFVLIIIISLHSCENSNNPIIPIESNFKYPLKVGTQWNYNYSETYSNFSNDSLKNYLENVSYRLNVTVVKDTLINNLQLAELKEEFDGKYSGYSYYANSESGLIEYAYREGSRTILPKINKTARIIFKNKYYNSFEELIRKQDELNSLQKPLPSTIIFYNLPRLSYKYPLEVKQEWIFNQGEMKIVKEVLGKEIVKTKTGTFECYKLQWKYYDLDGSIEDQFFSYEYVSSYGIIKKEFFIKNLAISTVENPEGFGKVDLKIETVLLSIN